MRQATWVAPTRSSTPSTTRPRVVTGPRLWVELGAAYFIPTFVVPALFITHAMIFRILSKRSR